MANVRSAIAVTIAPAALVATAVGVLLALRLAGAGFDGDPLAVVRDAPPGDRLWDVADRRGPVIGITLLLWLAAFCLTMAVSRERAGRAAARLLALSLVYLPLLCLAGAALESSVGRERLLILLGCPALAALTLFVSSRLVADTATKRELGGYRALAVACAATVLAYAVDVVAGSSLTQLSLVGPNPAAGHRFYGIGNELEAALVVLILVGTGAALTGFAPFPRSDARPVALLGTLTPLEWGQSAKRAATAFLLVAAVLSFVFAYGRYGADVGAAIALPCGAAVAAALCLDRPRLALLALAVPLPALAILAAVDLLSGADAHLTRTVLQAGGDDVAAVLGRRLRETGESFGRPILLAGLPFVLAGALAAWHWRDRIVAWLPDPPLWAGMAGALAAVLMGTLANDSGALLLEIGATYLAAFTAFAWAESRGSSAPESEGPAAAESQDGSGSGPRSGSVPGGRM